MSPLRTRTRSPIVAPEVQVYEEEKHWVVPKEEPKKDLGMIAKESSNVLSTDIGFADSLVSMMPSEVIGGKLLDQKLSGLSKGLSSIDKNAARRLGEEIEAIGSMLEKAQFIKKENEKGAAELAKEAEAKLNDLLENRIPLTRALDAIGTKEALLLKENYASTFIHAGTENDWRDAMMFESIALYLDGKAASELVESAGSKFDQRVVSLTKDISKGQEKEAVEQELGAIRDVVAGLKADLVMGEPLVIHSIRHRHTALLDIFGKDDKETETVLLERSREIAKAINGTPELDPGRSLLPGLSAVAKAAKDAKGIKRFCQLYLLKRYNDELDSWKTYKETGMNEDEAAMTVKELILTLKLSTMITDPSAKDFQAMQAILKWDEKEIPDCGFVRKMFASLNLIEKGQMDKAALVGKSVNAYFERVHSSKKSRLDIDSKLAFLSGISGVLVSAADPEARMNVESASGYLDSLGKRFSFPLVPEGERAAKIASSLSGSMSKPFIWSLAFRKDNIDNREVQRLLDDSPQIVKQALLKGMREGNNRLVNAAKLYATRREIFDSEEMAEQKALLLKIITKLAVTGSGYNADETIKSLDQLASDVEMKLSELVGEAREVPKIMAASAPEGFGKSYAYLAQGLNHALNNPYSLGQEDREATRHMIQAAVWFAGDRALWNPGTAKAKLDALVPAALRGEPLSQAKLAMWHFSMFQHEDHFAEGRKMLEAFKVGINSHFGIYDALKAYSDGDIQKIMSSGPIGSRPDLDQYLSLGALANKVLGIIDGTPGLKPFRKPAIDGFAALIKTTKPEYLEKAIVTYAKGLEKLLSESKLVNDDLRYDTFRNVFEVAALAQSPMVKGSGIWGKLVGSLGPWTPESMEALGTIASMMRGAATVQKDADKLFTPLAQRLMMERDMLGKGSVLWYEYLSALGKNFRADAVGDRELKAIINQKTMPMLAYAMDYDAKEAIIGFEGHEKVQGALGEIAQLLVNISKADKSRDAQDVAWNGLVKSSLVFPLVGKGLDISRVPVGMEWIRGVKGIDVPLMAKARDTEDQRKSVEYLLESKIKMLNWLYAERDDTLAGVFDKAGIVIGEFEKATGEWALAKYENKTPLQQSERAAIMELAKRDIRLVIDAGIYRKRLAKFKKDDEDTFESGGAHFTRAISVFDKSMIKFAKNEFGALKFSDAFRNELGNAGLFGKWSKEYSAAHKYQQRDLKIIESGDLPDSLRMGVVGTTKSCQAFNDDRVMVSGLVGAIELPWIKRIVVYDEEGAPIYRRVLMLVKEKGSDKPILLMQPVYKDERISEGLSKDLRKKVAETVGLRYGGVGGIEVRDIKGPMSDDSDDPKNYDYSTYSSGESPFCYVDSNANSSSPYGLHARTSGATLDFSKDWRNV